MLHGVGAETPTQVVVFLAAASAGGLAAGLVVLFAFVFGLVAANTLITLASAFGLAAAARRRSVQLFMGVATAVMSILVGGLFLFGFDGALPAFFAG
jgi:high-affinity nickel-transport protein